jgi:hypothetical protein
MTDKYFLGTNYLASIPSHQLLRYFMSGYAHILADVSTRVLTGKGISERIKEN